MTPAPTPEIPAGVAATGVGATLVLVGAVLGVGLARDRVEHAATTSTISGCRKGSPPVTKSSRPPKAANSAATAAVSGSGIRRGSAAGEDRAQQYLHARLQWKLV